MEVCPAGLRRRGVFHQAVGKGLRKRRLRDDPQLCPEIREAGTTPICAVREPREVCGSYALRKQISYCLTCGVQFTYNVCGVFITKKHRKPKLSMLFGAGGVTRTPDLLITNQLLYRLSYTSVFPKTSGILAHFFFRVKKQVCPFARLFPRGALRPPPQMNNTYCNHNSYLAADGAKRAHSRPLPPRKPRGHFSAVFQCLGIKPDLPPLRSIDLHKVLDNFSLQIVIHTIHRVVHRNTHAVFPVFSAFFALPPVVIQNVPPPGST